MQWKLIVVVTAMLSLSGCAFRAFTNDSEAELNRRMDVLDQKIAACEVQTAGQTKAAMNTPAYEALFTQCIGAKL